MFYEVVEWNISHNFVEYTKFEKYIVGSANTDRMRRLQHCDR